MFLLEKEFLLRIITRVGFWIFCIDEDWDAVGLKGDVSLKGILLILIFVIFTFFCFFNCIIPDIYSE